MVIFGWLRRFTVLGLKVDECTNCGNISQHAVGRKTHWGHVFWIPVLFLGFTHGMLCSICGHWTGIPWKTVRASMKTGVLAIDHPRPHAQAYLESLTSPQGFAPKASDVFDKFVVNPKRGFWDIYLKAWPALVALVLVVGLVVPKPTALAANGSAPSLTSYGTAHQCWEASDGSINGCRLANGSIDGDATGTTLTCYFYEPLPTSDTTIRCRED